MRMVPLRALPPFGVTVNVTAPGPVPFVAVSAIHGSLATAVQAHLTLGLLTGSGAEGPRRAVAHYRRKVRANEVVAQEISHAFLGIRLDCAQCHKHPFDRWTQDDFWGFAAFFPRVMMGYPADARAKVKPGVRPPFKEVFVAGKNDACSEEGEVRRR